MKREENKKTKSILTYVSLIILLVGLAVGLYFGFTHFKDKERLSKSDDFSVAISQQAKIVGESGDNININKIASDLKDKLNWLDYYNSEVSVVGDNNLVSTFYLKSLMNLEDDNPLTHEAAAELRKELVNLNFSLYFNSKVEFRSIHGDQLFDWQNGRVKFIQPPPPETEQPTTEKNEVKKVDDFFEEYDINLLKENSSELVFVDGQYLVKLNPLDDLFSEFESMLAFMEGNNADQEVNPNGNIVVIWIGYDFLENYLTLFDETYSAGTNLFDFCVPNPTDPTNINDVCKPFLITFDPAVQLSLFDKEYTVGVGRNLVNLENIRDRVNYSTTNYRFETVTTNLISPFESTGLSNKVVLIVLLSLFVFLVFSFTAWFGLLGLINSSLISLLGFVSLILLTTFSVPMTPLILAMAFLIVALTSFVSIYLLKKIKEDISIKKQRKSILKNSFSLSLSKGFFPFVSAIMIFIFLGFFLTSTPQSVFFLLSIICSIGYAMYLILFPLLVNLAIYPFNYFGEINKKWNITIGFVSKGSSSSKTSDFISKFSGIKTTKIFTISFALIFLAGFGVFFGLLGTTGSGFKLAESITPNYQYEVVSLNTREDDFDEWGPLDDPYKNKELANELELDSGQIELILKNQGININSKTLVRNEDYKLVEIVDPDSLEKKYEINYSFAYGYKFTSSDQITKEKFDSINSSFDNIAGWNNNSGYDLTRTHSLVDIDISSTPLEINNSTFNTQNNDYIFGILIATVLIFFSILFMFKWSGFAFSFTSSIFEIFFGLFLISLTFVGFSPTFWFFLPIGILMSLIPKILFNLSINRKNIKNEDDINREVNSSFSKLMLPNLIFNSIILIAPLTLFIVFGGEFLAPLIFMFGIFIVSTVSSLVIYPKLMKKFELKRINLKEKLHQVDVVDSRDPNQLNEEYIEGINY